jgi:hypothetical protein
LLDKNGSGTSTIDGGAVSVGVGSTVTNASASSMLLLTGGVTTFNNTGGAMFDIAGNSANVSSVTIDLGPAGAGAEDVTLNLATDRPLRGPGTGGCSTADCLTGTLFEASGATVTGDRLMNVDAALVEAAAPILKLLAASTLTLNGDAVTLANMARVISGTGISSAMIELAASSLTVNVGALMNVTGSSFLNVLGDLIRLSNTSTLTFNDVTNGYVMRVSGTSVVDVFGALIDFVGTGNKVKLANTAAPDITVGGVTVRLTGGATASQVEILGTPVRGLGTNGTIENLSGGAFTGSLIEVNGTSARVRIKGN